MDGLTITSESRGASTVVRVGGEVDAYTAPTLRERLDAEISAGHTHLVVGLEEVSFMDSSGLSVLVGGLAAARSRNGSLSLAGPDERILRVLTITGLTDVFEIFPSVGAACEAAGSVTSRHN